MKEAFSPLHPISLFYQRATSEHGDQPETAKMIGLVTILTSACFFVVTYITKINGKGIGHLIREFGVKLRKVKRTALEIERKAFHMTGLMVPLLYLILLEYFEWEQQDFASFSWLVTTCLWSADLIRVYTPNGNDYFPFSLLRNIIRDKEKTN